jgi:hypothetical protein
MKMLRSLFAALLALPMLLGLGSGGIGAPAARAQTADWRPDPDEQWLFELRTSRYTLGSGVRGYANGDRNCVDLGDIILALDLPIRLDRQLRRATGWAFDERRTLLIDREDGRVTVASSSESLPAGAIVDTPEGWCVDPAQLGEWLGVTFTTDLSNSIIRLESDQPLPFELAAQRRARAAAIRPQAQFSIADLPQAHRPYRMVQLPSVDVAASATTVHDARRGQSTRQTRVELFASGELLGVSVDARFATDNEARPQSLRVRAYRSDPSGQLLGPLAATHVAAGDVSSFSSPLATQTVTGRGAIVTNRPLDLPESFDRTTFRGDLPAGWEAELYRNGQLLGFASPDANGRYEFVDVRLMYGMNRFEIVLYGPQGQVRREIHSIPVGVDAIPPQQTYYWAGILQEERDLIRLSSDRRPYRRGWRGTFGLERGLNRRTSLGAWGTTLMIEDRRYTMVDASVRRSVASTLVELSGSYQSGGGRAARLFWLGQWGNSFFQAESLMARNGYRSDRIALGVTGLHSLSWDQSVRIGRSTILPLHLEARYLERADGQNRIEGAARVSANWRNISLTGQLDWLHSVAAGRSAAAPNVGGNDDVVATLLANARIGKFRVRGEAQLAVAGRSGQDKVAIVTEWNQSERSDWRVEVGYESAASRGRLGLGYTRRFDRLSLTGFAEVASDGSYGAGLSLSFGIGPDPRGGGIRFSRERLATEGQAVATVFYDDNGDGLRQAGERLAEGVVLTAGSAIADAPTDADGRTIIGELTPFRPVVIGIDETSIGNPLVRPAVPGIVVTPRPGVFTRLALPLISAGEVEGVLVRSGGSGIEGVDLEVVDSSGHVRATARTDFDGFFLFESVPYGNYTLRIADLSAQALGLIPTLATVRLDRDHQRVRLPPLAVNARSQLARAPPADGAVPAEAAPTTSAR